MATRIGKINLTNKIVLIVGTNPLQLKTSNGITWCTFCIGWGIVKQLSAVCINPQLNEAVYIWFSSLSQFIDMCMCVSLQYFKTWPFGIREEQKLRTKYWEYLTPREKLITKKRKEITLCTARFEVLTVVVVKIKVCRILHWADWKTLTFQRIRLAFIFCQPLVNYCSCSGWCSQGFMKILLKLATYLCISINYKMYFSQEILHNSRYKKCKTEIELSPY